MGESPEAWASRLRAQNAASVKGACRPDVARARRDAAARAAGAGANAAGASYEAEIEAANAVYYATLLAAGPGLHLGRELAATWAAMVEGDRSGAALRRFDDTVAAAAGMAGPVADRVAAVGRAALHRSGWLAHDRGVREAVGALHVELKRHIGPAASLRHAQPTCKVTGGGRKGPRVVLTGRSGPDFGGVLAGGRAVLVECKGFDKPRFEFAAHGKPTIAPEQAAALEVAHGAGALAGVVTRLNSPKPRYQHQPPPVWWWVPWGAWPSLAAVKGASIPFARFVEFADDARIARVAPGPWPDWLGAALALEAR